MQSNVSEIEIQKFSNLAKKWWDKNGPMKMLHVVNDLRFPFISNGENLHNLKVLDVGCGAGILTESMAKAGAIVTGIDVSKKVLDIAKDHKKHLNIQYYLQNSENFFKDHKEKFDIITCMEMLEHVPNPSSVVETCSKMLKKNGKIYYSTINRTLKAYLLTIFMGEYVLHMLPKGTHHYHGLIKPQELINWNEKQGLKHIKTSSFIYNPITKKFKLKEITDINYIMKFIKPF